MKWAYYNEWEPYCAQWLRNLIAAGHIPAGEVDERDIREVSGDDLKGYGQIHLFAGIGGWGYAARLAGIPDDAPVWTGSCPCQPFSSAGQAKGLGDERHLWPAFRRLIAECRPARIFGEQVASKDGRWWLAGVRADLEHLGYAIGAANLCAAGVKAKHPRQRIFFVANASSPGLARSVPHWTRLRSGSGTPSTEHNNISLRAGICFEPNSATLVRIDGLPRPVGQVRAYGNAIVPQVAAEFMMAARAA